MQPPYQPPPLQHLYAQYQPYHPPLQPQPEPAEPVQTVQPAQPEAPEAPEPLQPEVETPPEAEPAAAPAQGKDFDPNECCKTSFLKVMWIRKWRNNRTSLNKSLTPSTEQGDLGSAVSGPEQLSLTELQNIKAKVFICDLKLHRKRIKLFLPS